MSLFSHQTLIQQYGYVAVFTGIFFEDFGLPAPGEAVLIAGALLASQGELHIAPLLIIAIAGAVAGDNVGFLIGRYGGRRLILRFGRYLLITRERLNRAEHFFQKRGAVVVVFARFFEVLRQLNGIVAGTAKMRWWRFLGYNALGAVLWVGFWGLLFYELGAKATGMFNFFKKTEFFIIGALVLLIAGIGAYLLHRKLHK